MHGRDTICFPNDCDDSDLVTCSFWLNSASDSDVRFLGRQQFALQDTRMLCQRGVNANQITYR
jgi:hypothetical protein